jgi:hypothetical protein
LWGDAQLIQELAARSDLIQINPNQRAPACPPKNTSLPSNARGLVSVDSKGIRNTGKTSGGNLSAQPVSPTLAWSELS